MYPIMKHALGYDIANIDDDADGYDNNNLYE